MDDSSRQKDTLALNKGNLPIQENSGIDLESKGKQEASRSSPSEEKTRNIEERDVIHQLWHTT
jgi:hypothetical protein